MQKSNLFIYLIYIFLCFIIFLIDSYVGLVLVVFSYLLLFFLNLKKNGSIFNHVQFYLLVCWILTFTQIFNVFLFDESLFYDEKLYFFYCVVISGIIAIFFNVPKKNDLLFEKKFKKVENPYLFKYILALFAIILLGIYGLFGSALQYIVKSLFFIIPVILSGLYYLTSSKKLIPIILFVISFLFYTSIMFNRTGYLLVPIIFFVTILIDKKFKIDFKKNINFIITSVFLILIMLLLADIYKGSNTRNFVDFVQELKLTNLINYFSETRYKLNPTHNIYDYFSIMDALTDDQKEIGGNIFTQFANIFKPRFFFPDKPIQNISELNYMQGIHSSTLFVAVFMESTYNLGLIGVFIYHYLILLIGSLMFKSILVIEDELLFKFFSINYFFYIIYMYTLIRGPGVHFISYFFISFMIMLFYLRKLKKKET